MRPVRAGARGTAASQSQAGRQWLVSLPGVVAALSSQWGLVVDDATRRAGFNAVVMPALRHGAPCVLKVAWPQDQSGREARALRAWHGEGAVRLLEADDERGALLLERLDDATTLSSVPLKEAGGIAGGLLRRLAVPSPGGFVSVRDLASQFAAELDGRQRRLGDPIPERWADSAAEHARGLGTSIGTSLVHGDLHYGNVLAATREPWLAIDPKPTTGDPEWAVPELLWTRADELASDREVRELLAAVVAAGDLSEPLAIGCSIVRCVDYWLWGLEHGLTDDPGRCERILEVLC